MGQPALSPAPVESRLAYATRAAPPARAGTPTTILMSRASRADGDQRLAALTVLTTALSLALLCAPLRIPPNRLAPLCCSRIGDHAAVVAIQDCACARWVRCHGQRRGLRRADGLLERVGAAVRPGLAACSWRHRHQCVLVDRDLLRCYREDKFHVRTHACAARGAASARLTPRKFSLAPPWHATTHAWGQVLPRVSVGHHPQ